MSFDVLPPRPGTQSPRDGSELDPKKRAARGKAALPGCRQLRGYGDGADGLNQLTREPGRRSRASLRLRLARMSSRPDDGEYATKENGDGDAHCEPTDEETHYRLMRVSTAAELIRGTERPIER